MHDKNKYFIWNFIKKYKISFISVLFLAISCDILHLIATNSIFKDFIDKISANNLNFYNSALLLILYAICSSAIPIMVMLRKVMAFGYQFKLKEDIRNYIFNYSLKQSNKFFTANFVGTLNSKINDITNNIGEFLNKSIDIISHLVSFITSLIIFAQKNIQFSLFFFFWTVIYFYIYYRFSIKIEKQTEVATDIESKCSGKIVDCFTNILNIKNFAREEQEKENVQNHTKIILKERFRVCTTMAKLDFFNFLGRVSFLAVVSLISLKMYFDKIITIGELTFNINLSAQLFFALRWALQMAAENFEAYGKMKQAIETLIVEQEIKDKEYAKQLDILNGKIEFKNISFGYDN